MHIDSSSYLTDPRHDDMSSQILRVKDHLKSELNFDREKQRSRMIFLLLEDNFDYVPINVFVTS